MSKETKKLVSGIVVSLLVACVYLFGISVFGSKIYTSTFIDALAINYLLFCFIPIFLFSFYLHKGKKKKPFISDIELSIWASLTISIMTGWLFGSWTFGDTTTVLPFNFGLFVFIFITCFTILTFITYVLLFLCHKILARFAKKVST